MEMITIYRNGQPIDITREQFDRDTENLATLRANAKIVAHYSTRGGKHQIVAKSYEWEDQTCYDVQDLTGGKSSGGGGGAMTPEQFAMYLGRRIYFGRKAGTNYRAIVAHADTESLLERATKEA